MTETYIFFIVMQDLSELSSRDFSSVKDFVIAAFPVEVLVDPRVSMSTEHFGGLQPLTAQSVWQCARLSHPT